MKSLFSRIFKKNFEKPSFKKREGAKYANGSRMFCSWKFVYKSCVFDWDFDEWNQNCSGGEISFNLERRQNKKHILENSDCHESNAVIKK